MRDMMMLAMMFLMVPLALSNSFAAYLLWGYTSLLVAKVFMYGFMQEIRYNLIFAVIALVMLLAGRLKYRGSFYLNRTNILLVAWLCHATISSLWGYEPSQFNSERLVFFVKVMIFCLASPLFLTSRLRIHSAAVMLGLALGLLLKRNGVTG